MLIDSGLVSSRRQGGMSPRTRGAPVEKEVLLGLVMRDVVRWGERSVMVELNKRRTHKALIEGDSGAETFF